MIVCVTGASAGFGTAVARRFSREGARVIIAGRRAERLNELARELGSSCLPLAFDVRDRTSVEQALGNLPDEFAHFDVLRVGSSGAKNRDNASRALGRPHLAHRF